MTEEQPKTEIQSERATAPTPVSPEADVPLGPSFALRALRWTFRLIVVILLGIALGAGIFYGARRVYRDAIEPLQTLDQRMQALETSESKLRDTMREDRSSNAESVSDLEGRLAVQAEDMASIAAQISRLDMQIEDQSAMLAELTDLQDKVDQLGQDLGSVEDQLESLGQLVQAGELPVDRVERKLQLLRVMNLMTRTRLWIEQANYGLAGEDISAALRIMQAVGEQAELAGEEPNAQWLEITDRLNVALEITRSNPALAEQELEIVWKLLIEVTSPEALINNTPTEEG